MALSLLRKGDIKSGQKVLINGASGGIGSLALQLAKNYGAEVTAVCGTPRLEYVRSLGADMVIDYTREDFTRNGERYDLIFDVLGRSSFSRCKNSLTPNGRYLLASFKMKQLVQMLWTSIFGGKKVICALASENREDLSLLRELVEAGRIKTIIDRCYSLEEIAEAHRYVERGLRKGHVVITI
jgi:NADPH:quinone reductase-like Zn-dependent oxidoreductase